MKSMIKIIATFALLLFVGSVSAQYWNANGTHIYNTNSGNVGIGINSPNYDLHLQDDEGECTFTMSQPYSGTSNQKIGTFDITNPTTGDLFRLILRKQDGDYEMLQTAYSASQSKWYAYARLNYTTAKYEVRQGLGDYEFLNRGSVLFNNPIGSDTGNVGIGITSIPSGYKLAVGGKVIAEELEIQLTADWPDYVFDKDYKLRSLSDLEKFINENGHLPEIPPAEEIEASTLKVGEMNAKLLQKIEELTLYLIELKKENETLKKQVNSLLE